MKDPFENVSVDAYGNKRPIKEYYKDFYGCTASIYRRPDDPVVTVTIYDDRGRIVVSCRPYRTYRGAKIALGKMSDCWTMTGREEM